MRHEDLEAVDYLCKRDRTVCKPFLDGLLGLDDDDKVIRGALKVALRDGVISSHCGWLLWFIGIGRS